MTFSALGQLLPELILLIGACALLIVGLTRFARTPGALSLLAGGITAAALVARACGSAPIVVYPGILVASAPRRTARSR